MSSEQVVLPLLSHALYHAFGHIAPQAFLWCQKNVQKTIDWFVCIFLMKNKTWEKIILGTPAASYCLHGAARASPEE